MGKVCALTPAVELREIWPSFPADEAGNSGLGDAVLLAQTDLGIRSRSIRSQNAYGIILSKHSAAVILASIYIQAVALMGHVRHVIGMGAYKQMIGVNAWWVIAMVADANPVRDCPIRESPCQTMGKPILSVVVQLTIAIFMKTGIPYPARIFQFGALGPKLFWC